MNPGERPLHRASRIYFGIHHPIQYNVKVKALGQVHQDSLPYLLGYWAMEQDGHGLNDRFGREIQDSVNDLGSDSDHQSNSATTGRAERSLPPFTPEDVQ
jgi:hypothetical protein